MDTIVAAGSGMAEGAPERPQFAQQADLKPQAQPGVALEPVDSGMPLIVLMGMPSAGKTSILQVLFNKLSPHETLHKSMSTHVQFDEIHYSDFVHFEVCDVPGHVDVSSLDAASEIFSRCSALIFVIDAQNAPYMDALQKFVHTVAVAQQIKDDIRIEVFIHKVEELSDEQCGITLRDIQAEILDESFVLQTSFHLTSIYDPSIYEAFSKVVQKLNPNVGMLESLLDLLISHCRLEKAFLFDVASKIYVASDSSPLDSSSFQLCSEMVEVVVDISGIYGYKGSTASDDQRLTDHGRSATERVRDGAKDEPYEAEVFDSKSFAIIKIQESNFDKFGLIEFNFNVFRDALEDSKRRASAQAEQGRTSTNG